MKLSRLARLALAAAVVVLPVAGLQAAAPPKMKMTTPIPEGIETPNVMDTHLGVLSSFDAVPDKATTQKVYDDLDLRRATEAFLAALPIASMAAMEKGVRSFGPPNVTAALFENQRTWAFVEKSGAPLLAIAQQAGFTQESFAECLSNTELFEQIVEMRTRGARDFGVESTPTFFINGERHSGALTLAEFEAILDPLLN